MKNSLVAQSGGPTSVINASLSGVIRACIEIDDHSVLYGAQNGIMGVLGDQLINLTNAFSDSSQLQLLKHSPAMYLGSCRFKLPSEEKAPEVYDSIFKLFEKYEIGFFYYIGGNDSMDTVHKLSDYAVRNNYDVKIMGIPKTIDNDLMGTDHTPGFGSAAKYVATSILEVAHDTYIYDLASVTIIEIMGRNAGWLTAAAALARTDYSGAPDLIYLPEVPFDKSSFIIKLKELLKTKRNVIIAASEGIKDAQGHYIAATASDGHDAFGHAKLSGVGKTLEHWVNVEVGCKVRSIELNVLQRSAMHIASLTDVTEAEQVGVTAVAFAHQGMTGRMVGMIRESESPYLIAYKDFDISKIANHEKEVPLDWINETHDDVLQPAINYMLPLIEGQPTLNFKNGIPQYISIKHLQ